MKNLCRATFLALCSSGLLSVATPAVALSGGASCDDPGSSGYGYGPGRPGPLPRRHERRAPPEWARSPAPRRTWAGPGPERPERMGPPLDRTAWADQTNVERSRWNRPAAPEFDRPSSQPPARHDRATRGFHSRSAVMEPPARPERALPRRVLGYPGHALTRSRLPRPSPYFAPPPGNAAYHARGLMPPPPRFYRPLRPWAEQLPAGPGATGGATPAADTAALIDSAPPVAHAAGSSEAETVTAAAPAADTDIDGVADATDFCPGSAAGTKVDSFGCAATETIVLRGVNFHADSAQLTDGSHTVLDNVAKTLIAHPEIHVEIAGHTDSDGDADHNFDLSARRAIMVMKHLAEAGVSPDNMIARGYGEERPIAPNDTPEGKAENRRVELSPLD
jgi:outer membrane protein OmpA-like peptidoglycan-associated protein